MLEKHQECFSRELFRTKPDLPYQQYSLAGHQDQIKAPSMMFSKEFSLTPTQCHLYSCLEKKHIKKNNKRTVGT